jgi:hypothetical protein
MESSPHNSVNSHPLARRKPADATHIVDHLEAIHRRALWEMIHHVFGLIVGLGT